MKILNALISVSVLIIGIYMLSTNWGAITPPVLSGIAFILLGIGNCSSCMEKK